eukprot:TRINITY_DN14105_c1_g1_i1.p1 TRINITY_DN14105_c1_g1~~TRINITY_DN14105_c1_g1_i1.p1  ORF type:complete len:187 (+),score=37.26 TRINITY_DN14105_c1_g1_i1:54-614(+)
MSSTMAPTTPLTPIASIMTHPMTPTTMMLPCESAPAVSPTKEGTNAIDKTKLKSKLCNRWLAGTPCRFGDRCAFAHGEMELRSPEQNVSQPILVGAGRSESYPGDMSGSVGESYLDADCESELYGTPLTTTFQTPTQTPLGFSTNSVFPQSSELSGTWRNDPYCFMSSRVAVPSESASDEESVSSR